MDLLSALVGLFGGALNYFGVDRQASAAEAIARERGATARAFYDLLADLGMSKERIEEIRAMFAQSVAQEEATVQRTRIFYNYQALAAARGMVIALAGAGILGVALYLAAKEGA